MIKTNKKIKVITAKVNVEEILVVEPSLESISTNVEQETYSVNVQDFYLVDDVKYPIGEVRVVTLNMSDVYNKEGSFAEKIKLSIVDELNTDLPYGTTEGDWIYDINL